MTWDQNHIQRAHCAPLAASKRRPGIATVKNSLRAAQAERAPLSMLTAVAPELRRVRSKKEQ